MTAWRGCSSSVTISNQCYRPACELEESSGDEREGIRNAAGSRTLFLSPPNPVEAVGFLKGNTCYRTWTLCNILVWPHRAQMMSPGRTLLKPSWRTLDFASALPSSTGLRISIAHTFFSHSLPRRGSNSSVSQTPEFSEGSDFFNPRLGAASCCLQTSSHRRVLWKTLLHRLQTRCIVLMNW